MTTGGADLITGRCLCGGVVYSYEGAIGPAGYCHCEDCRRRTGSAFNVSVRLHVADFRVTRGAPRPFVKQADSGRELTRYFCADCGSPLYTSSPAHPEFIFVKAGSFDDPNVVRATHQSWVGSSVRWSRIAPDLPSKT